MLFGVKTLCRQLFNFSFIFYSKIGDLCVFLWKKSEFFNPNGVFLSLIIDLCSERRNEAPGQENSLILIQFPSHLFAWERLLKEKGDEKEKWGGKMDLLFIFPMGINGERLKKKRSLGVRC